MAFKVNTGPEGSISGRGARRKRARIDTAAVGAKRRTCETLGRASASGHVTVGVGASAVWIGSKLCTGPFYTGPDVHA
jgi:hypothetical protein